MLLCNANAKVFLVVVSALVVARVLRMVARELVSTCISLQI